MRDIHRQAFAPARLVDCEMIDLLEIRIASGEPNPRGRVREMNVYSAHPREILGDGEQEALFFSSVERAGGGSTDRRKREATAPAGGGDVWYWYQDHGKEIIQDRAYKRKLYFVSKTRKPNPCGGKQKSDIKRLGYIMIEYELKNQDAGAKDLVLCKVYRKSSCTNPETAMATGSRDPEPPTLMQATVSKLAPFAVQVDPPRSFPAARSNCTPMPHMRLVHATSEEGRRRHGGEKPTAWPTIVMKFGRSLLASAEGIKHLANLLRGINTDTPVVVLAAMGKTTDNLLHAVQQSMRCHAQEVCAIHELVDIKDSHLSTVDELAHDTLDQLELQLKRIARTKDLSAEKQNYLLSFGERLSTKILSTYLKKLGTKAQQYIALDLGLATADKATDILQATYSAIAEQLKGDWMDEPAMPIIAGFLVKELCAVTTFERGVSDLTAITIGRALESREIQIWKGVDGLFTCDPNICSNAIPIPFLTFHETAELVHCAKVLHPDTSLLAEEGGIPVRVKNFYNPHSPGTLITTTKDMCKSMLTGIVLESNFTVLDIERTRNLGQNSVLANVLSILEDSGISVDYMATNKGKMSLALDPSKLLSCEMIQPVIENIVQDLQETAVVHVLQHRSVISLVGNTQMSPFILGMASNVLWRIGVKVQMISQGSSNSEVMKVSLMVHESEAKYCVQELHSTFFDNGVLPNVEEAENKSQYSSTAASSSEVKKRKLADTKHSVPVQGDNICDQSEPFVDILKEKGPLLVDNGDSVRMCPRVTHIAEEYTKEPMVFDQGEFPPGTVEEQQGIPEAEMMEGGSAPGCVLLESESGNQETRELNRIALKPSRQHRDNGGDSTGSVAVVAEVENTPVVIAYSVEELNSFFL